MIPVLVEEPPQTSNDNSVDFELVAEDVIDGLTVVLGPAARRIAAAGEINYPNPMGLPNVLED